MYVARQVHSYLEQLVLHLETASRPTLLHLHIYLYIFLPLIEKMIPTYLHWGCIGTSGSHDSLETNILGSHDCMAMTTSGSHDSLVMHIMWSHDCMMMQTSGSHGSLLTHMLGSYESLCICIYLVAMIL